MGLSVKVVLQSLVIGLVLGLTSATAVADDPDHTPTVVAEDNRAQTTDYRQRARLGSATRKSASPYRHLRDHRGFFHISPILGAPGLFGNVEVEGQSGELSADPISTVRNIDLTTGAAVEVGYGNVSITGDFRYFDVATDAIDVDNGGGTFALEQFVSTVAVNWAYQPIELVQLGPVAGIRHVYARSGLGQTADNDDGQASVAEQWFDPIVGLNGRLTFADDRVFVPFYGDVGGIGFGSELTWQGYAGVGVGLNRTEFELGYQALYTDYDGDQFGYNVLQTGPILTTTFRF